ncbi:MAG: RNA polymerase sigma factor [Alphaproteobacteria bacterium]|nr:RNA polymerase sigma factor [Alphaproteobacteria bacterium]
MLTDGELVQAARRGQKGAFTALMTRHQSAARSFARRLSADPGEADDIAQDAFVFAWSNLHRLRAPERFKSWLLGAVLNTARSRMRSRARRRARDGAWLDAAPQAAQAPGEAAVTAVQLFQALSLDQRAALALCHGEGWSHAEAAEMLGQPLGTVKSNIRRAKEKLRTLLGEP